MDEATEDSLEDLSAELGSAIFSPTAGPHQGMVAALRAFARIGEDPEVITKCDEIVRLASELCDRMGMRASETMQSLAASFAVSRQELLENMPAPDESV